MFSYELPPERIAQQPAAALEGKGRRTDSRLLVGRASGCVTSIEDRSFRELVRYLHAGDLLVLNNTKVIPCRFFTQTPTGAEIEILLLFGPGEISHAISSPHAGTRCEFLALARPMRRLNEGVVLKLGEGFFARVLGRNAAGDQVRLELEVDANCPVGSIEAAVLRYGQMPIPPYIRGGVSNDSDREFYQTVFGEVSGSVAAPTASLHFTTELLEEIVGLGVEVAYLTLHVGTASFVPLKDRDIAELQTEYYTIPNKTVEAINSAKKRGGAVVAVGTTTTRALESAALLGFAGVGEGLVGTKLLIKPGYEFKVVDKLITNFHQPNTSHLYLVGAFFGEENIRTVYEHALQGEYRFLSYGDSMFLSRG